MSVLDIVTDPRRFFEQRRENLSVLLPAVLVLLVAVLRAVESYVTFELVLEALPADAQGFGEILMASTVVGTLIGVLVAWIVFGAVFHAIASLAFEGDGSFSETLAVTGWGNVPKVLGALVSLAITYYVFQVQGVTIPSAADQRAFQQAMQALQNSPILQVSTVLGVVFTLWSAFIWTFGLSEVQDIEVREAAIAVGVPVAISILWTVYNLL